VPFREILFLLGGQEGQDLLANFTLNGSLFLADFSNLGPLLVGGLRGRFSGIKDLLSGRSGGPGCLRRLLSILTLLIRQDSCHFLPELGQFRAILLPQLLNLGLLVLRQVQLVQRQAEVLCMRQMFALVAFRLVRRAQRVRDR
jgi:hypothetical protein